MLEGKEDFGFPVSTKSLIISHAEPAVLVFLERAEKGAP